MSQSNIDRFDEIAGRIFADLYNAFPIPCPLNLAAFLDGVDVLDPSGFTGSELTQDAEFVKSTIEWLIAAEFLTANNFHGTYFGEAILTAKGLECLKLMPESLSAPAGSELSKAVKLGSKETVKMITNHVLAFGVKLVARRYGLSE